MIIVFSQPNSPKDQTIFVFNLTQMPSLLPEMHVTQDTRTDELREMVVSSSGRGVGLALTSTKFQFVE